MQARVGLAGAADVDAAVGAARAAQPAWASLSPVRRARVLFRLADLLEQHETEAAELGALDNGTPISVMNPGRVRGRMGAVLRRAGATSSTGR